MTERYGYVVIPAWEYDIVAEEGIFSTGGVCIFVDKKDAIAWGEKNAQLLMPEEVVQVYVQNIQKEVPIIELYTNFYLASIDVDLLERESNYAPELLAEEDLPMLWFTKERIPTLCIIHTEQIPI